MKVLRQLTALPDHTAACIGAFDGFHLGHQALLRRADALARRVAVVTFDPHPARVLAPERAPRLLQTPGQRARVCAALGVDLLVLLPFDRELASMSPRAFVDRVLLAGLRPESVIVGPDFRFGAGRRGGTDELRNLLEEAGVTLDVAPEVPCPADVSAERRKLSSTGIRQAVRAGAVAEILPMLGRFYAVEGTVVRGAMRGRTLGFPTANVDTAHALLPRPGVYAAVLQVADEQPAARRWRAVANLGTNPTFHDDADGRPPALEVHALDADALGESLYGLEVEVAFVHRLRDEQRFAGPEPLRAQIARDIAAARERLSDATLSRVDPRPIRRPA